MPEIAESLPLLLLLLFVGAVAGVLAGLLGVGGGIVLVPALLFVFTSLGYGGENIMQVAIATSLATIVVTSIRSVIGHNRKNAVEWDVLKAWAPGIAVGAICGVLAATQLRGSQLQAIFGALATIVGFYMLFSRENWRVGQELPRGAGRIGLSGLVGFLSVLMGIGGGSFGVPLLTLYGRPIHNAVATAAGFGLIIAVPSVVGFLLMDLTQSNLPPFTIGAVNLVAFALIISMTLLTTPLGVRLAHMMDPAPLKRTFAVFLILVALNMIRRSLGW